MFKKYITIQIIPSTSKKVKKVRVSQFFGLVIVFFSSIFLLHTTWVFFKYFSHKPLHNYNEIKKNYKEKKIFLTQYEKKIEELEEKITELKYDYDVLKSESILSNSKKSNIKESRAVIRNLERSKKSIFSSIPSEESTWNFSFTNADFNNFFDFLLKSHPDNTKAETIPVNGFLISSFGQNSLDSPRSGILLYTDPKTPVKATLGGIVVYAGSDDILSKTVIIYHSDYTFTTYGNLFEIKVKRLQRVSKGEIVALGGNEEFPSVFYQKDFLFIPQNPF